MHRGARLCARAQCARAERRRVARGSDARAARATRFSALREHRAHPQSMRIIARGAGMSRREDGLDPRDSTPEHPENLRVGRGTLELFGGHTDECLALFAAMPARGEAGRGASSHYIGDAAHDALKFYCSQSAARSSTAVGAPARASRPPRARIKDDARRASRRRGIPLY